MSPLWYLAFVTVFLLGLTVGSFLNVCVFRIPFEKCVHWPGSRCGKCYQPIRWYDNLPLLSYWLLGGRCRTCGAAFSIRYFLVELFTGLAFLGLFVAEVVFNVLDIPALRLNEWQFQWGVVPVEGWVVFGYHAVLMSFLIAASLCDLEHMEIPLTITVTGTIVGIVGSMFVPWPWPNAGVPVATQARADLPWLPPGVINGAYPWPVWYPLPAWLPPGSWQLGLVTSLAGALAGMLALRGVRSLFGWGRGLEGLGMGDADLMMMAGAFVGWQVILVAFFAGVLPGLVFGLIQLFSRGDKPLPFGPALAIGVMIALLCWPSLGPPLALVFFDPVFLGVLAGMGGVFLLVAGFVLRLLRGVEPDPPTP